MIVAGSKTNEIFIENGRFHGKLIAAHLRQVMGNGNAPGTAVPRASTRVLSMARY